MTGDVKEQCIFILHGRGALLTALLLSTALPRQMLADALIDFASKGYSDTAQFSNVIFGVGVF